MLRKLLVLAAFSVAGFAAAVSAQDAPKEPTERRVQGMVALPFERSYLGVQMQEINKENYSRFGLAAVRGVGVEKVLENSPAATGGLQNNDVIVRFDGEPVESIAKLSRLIAEVAPDHQAKITVLRGGNEAELNVTMGKREFPAFQNGVRIQNFPQMQRLLTAPFPPMNPLPPSSAQSDGNVFIWRGNNNRQIGIGVTELTEQLSDFFGVGDDAGVLISNVRENSPAAKAGLKAGDIIVEADGKTIKRQTDLIRAVNDKKEGEVSLTIIRKGDRRTVRVAPETSKNGAANFPEFESLFEAAPPASFNFQTPPAPTAPLPATVVRTAPRIL